MPSGPRGRPSRPQRTRVNADIKIAQVRVIGADGAQLGIMPTYQARQLAVEAGLDLVEVAAEARPPVCKIVDYSKLRYEEQRKERAARKNQVKVEWREVQFRPDTGDHDIEYKTRNARTFLEEGARLRLVMRFRGRERAHPELARRRLLEVAAGLADVGAVVQQPLLEGKNMSMTMFPLKDAPAVRPTGPAQPTAQAPALLEAKAS